MLASVDLDHQASLKAGEVDDIRTKRHLAAEAITGDLLDPQAHPQT